MDYAFALGFSRTRLFRSVRSSRNNPRLISARPTFPPPLLSTHRQRSIRLLSLLLSVASSEVTSSLIITDDAMAKLDGETEKF